VVEIDLEHNYINVPLYFVHNLEAEQGYDIWDANKLFSTSGIPEPYFVTEGVNLVKEEVNELPYYATVNIRSEKDTVVTLIAKTIPEGYAVSLIDGEQETDLNEGGRYPIEITTGENADRFKLLVRKNVGLEEVANTDIKISNNNRHITITAQDKVKVSVYNIHMVHRTDPTLPADDGIHQTGAAHQELDGGIHHRWCHMDTPCTISTNHNSGLQAHTAAQREHVKQLRQRL